MLGKIKKISAKRKMRKNGSNLVLLGIISVVIAITTTSVSLAIYHNSGDIYLDRSRPGFLPDEDENQGDDDGEPEYTFSKTGKITIGDLEEYLENLEVDVRAIDSYEDPFSEDALSDEYLGISVEE